MSEFSKELQVTAEFCYERPIDVFNKHIPLAWVEEAVQQTGRVSLRKRRLPAEQAVWYGLQRNRSIQDVCDKLELAFPDVEGELTPMVTSSIIKGKERLGDKPIRYLFKTIAQQWEHHSRVC